MSTNTYSISESDVFSESSDTTPDVKTPISESTFDTISSVSSDEDSLDKSKTIINHRIQGNKKQYLIKYSDFPNSPQWVDEADLAKDSKLIVEYLINGNSSSKESDKENKSKMSFEITGATQNQGKIYYQLLYQDGSQTSLSSKKTFKLDSFKLIDFLEDYCLKHHKFENS